MFYIAPMMAILTICCLNPAEENVPFSSVRWSEILLAKDTVVLAVLICSLSSLGLILICVDIPLDIFGCSSFVIWCVKKQPNHIVKKGNIYISTFIIRQFIGIGGITRNH